MRNEEMERVVQELAEEVMQRTSHESLSIEDRIGVLTELQIVLVNKVREYPGNQGLTISYQPEQTTKRFIEEFLSVAREHGEEGPVAEYIVGAKLQ